MAANIVDEWIEQGVEQGIAQGIEKGIEKGIAQGIEKGIEKGIAQGIEKEKNTVVRNLLEQGLLTVEQIAAVVGVDPSRVREIRDRNG